MPEAAVRRKEDVKIDQDHDQAGAVHDVDMHPGIRKATEHAEQHPVTGDHNGDYTEPHPDEKELEDLNPQLQTLRRFE